MRQRDESRAAIDAWSALLVSKRRDVEVRSAGLNEQQEFLRRRIADIDGRLEADAKLKRVQPAVANKLSAPLGQLLRCECSSKSDVFR